MGETGLAVLSVGPLWVSHQAVLWRLPPTPNPLVKVGVRRAQASGGGYRVRPHPPWASAKWSTEAWEPQGLTTEGDWRGTHSSSHLKTDSDHGWSQEI